MVAVMMPVDISALITDPGTGGPVEGTALGTAIKAVVSSLQTNMLSVEPGRLIVEETLSLALLTIAKPLLEGLKTSVRSRFGLTTIIPAFGTAPLSDTTKALKLSVVASTMSSAGNPPPLNAGWSGFETKARNLIPLWLPPPLDDDEL